MRALSKPATMVSNTRLLLQSDLQRIRDELVAAGTIPPHPVLQSYYDTFRRRFGPEALRALDGRLLLDHMHAHGTRDSLVYWLEFKDDTEFPALFGSITGGSALKFGVYKRAETGTWAAKGSGPAPRDISLEEAVAIAQQHRDQLLAAVNVVSSITPSDDDQTYLRLQRDLERVAPDIEDTVWAHKYLALIFPDVLDTFHVQDFQRYQLTRMLQTPPRDGDDWALGRYVCSGRFVGIARSLDMHLHEAAIILNHRHGAPRGYWRIGTTDNDRERRKYWPFMRDGDLIAVGWQKIRDLSALNDERPLGQVVKELVATHYPGTAGAMTRSARQLTAFVDAMAEGDRVAVVDGQTVLGIAEIAGPYMYDREAGFPHQRPVVWRSLKEWKLTEGLQNSVVRLKDPENLVEIERHILGDGSIIHERSPTPVPSVRAQPPREPSVRNPVPRLGGVAARIQSVLERKGQAIIYGPPGTGKTYWALKTVRDLASLRAFGAPYENLNSEQIDRVDGSHTTPLVRLTSFHPEYGYEDFIEGYRAGIGDHGSLLFTLVPGQFKQLCADAASTPAFDFFLVIDEINRGDIPRIFGELLTLLELDKRGRTARLAVSGDRFVVPPNVFVVGTMNTSDRSVALLDVALRRRFGFIELMPDYSLLQGAFVGSLPLAPWLEYVNRRIRDTGGGDARNRQIGHAYLLPNGKPISTVDQFAAVLRDDIVPLLEEYCYEDFSQLAEIMGEKLIDIDRQRIRSELFEAGRGTDLIDALMQPEISTTSGAVRLADSVDQDEELGEDSPEETEV